MKKLMIVVVALALLAVAVVPVAAKGGGNGGNGSTQQQAPRGTFAGPTPTIAKQVFVVMRLPLKIGDDLVRSPRCGLGHDRRPGENDGEKTGQGSQLHGFGPLSAAHACRNGEDLFGLRGSFRLLGHPQPATRH